MGRVRQNLSKFAFENPTASFWHRNMDGGKNLKTWMRERNYSSVPYEQHGQTIAHDLKPWSIDSSIGELAMEEMT